MKKKIINGILMVALVAATSTSFVSCKDNDEDVKTDLIYKIDQEKAQLQKDYIAADQALETAIKKDIKDAVNDPNSDLQKALETWIAAKKYATEDWVKDWCDKENDYLKSAEFPDTLAKYLKENEDFKNVTNTLWGEDGKSGLVKDVADALAQIAVNRDSIKILNQRVDTVNHRIATIMESLRNMITSVTVNATTTNILENSKVFPGLNMQFLGAIYGKAEAEVNFPDVDASELADGVKKEDIESGSLIYNKDMAAGKVYFTVNPSNITAARMQKVALSLINSQNAENALLTIGKATESKKVLTWGTRADGDTFNPTLWEAPVTFTSDLKALGQIEPAKLINIEQVAQHVKAMVKEAKEAAQDANRNNYSSTGKTATKEILKEAAQMIAELAQTKVPALPALALKAEWSDTVGTRSVISDYSIAATAYKPVSFTWGKGVVSESDVISLDKIDNLAARIVNKIKSVEPNMDKYVVTEVKAVSLTDIEVTVKDTTDPTKTAKGTVKVNDLNKNINDIVTDLNKNLTMLNGAIDDIKSILAKANSALDRSLSLEKRVSNFLESYINRIIVSVANNGFQKVLQPILLLDNDGAVNRIVSGATMKAGDNKVIMTTVTNELLAPVYKKYIAVVAGGKVTGKVLTNGDENFKNETITLAKGQNTIVYAAVDFYGNQIVKRYTVTAE